MPAVHSHMGLNRLIDNPCFRVKVRRQIVEGFRLKRNYLSGQIKRFACTFASVEVMVEVCSGECDDERFFRVQAMKTVDRRIATACMQRDEQIISAVFVCLGDGDMMTKFLEDARPSQRCYAIAVPGPGGRRGGDKNLHHSFENAQCEYQPTRLDGWEPSEARICGSVGG